MDKKSNNICRQRSLTNQNDPVLVKRKEALIKLGELKRIYGSFFGNNPELSFYRLLSDAAYRETTLLKLLHWPQPELNVLANEILGLAVTGSLLNEGPSLGEEVQVRIYSDSDTEKKVQMIELKQASIRWPKMIFTLLPVKSSVGG